MSFTPQPEGESPRVILDANPSYGAAFGVRLDEENLVEFRWARQDTNLHLEGDIPTFPRERVLLDEFHGDFTHEYILEDWYRWARPFVTGSVGATRISGGSNNSFTRFSFGLGVGVKMYVSRHVGFRVQAAWLPIWVEPEVTSFICGNGCAVHVGGKLASQGEITLGPTFRF